MRPQDARQCQSGRANGAKAQRSEAGAFVAFTVRVVVMQLARITPPGVTACGRGEWIDARAEINELVREAREIESLLSGDAL